VINDPEPGRLAMTSEVWLSRRTFRADGFDPEALAERKRALGLTVSVCLPTLDVAETVGPIVETVRRCWVQEVGLVDQVAIVDCRSSDDTARVAAEAGAEVFQVADILPELAPGRGKGEALWKSLAAVSGDLVVWLDSDVSDFDATFVPGLLGPLLTEPGVGYVKALYRRPLGESAEGGGRVTEICARPLISLFYPELSALVQPLSGEAAGRRALLERLPFMSGYAVEIGLLLDIVRRFGLEPLAQVDLGERHHRHQDLAALGEMAYEIVQAMLRRLAADGRAPKQLARAGPYLRPVARGTGAGYVLRALPLEVAERPPARSVAAYRDRRRDLEPVTLNRSGIAPCAP
jgi:glucosyl-3-phosphoglycerate synthase